MGSVQNPGSDPGRKPRRIELRFFTILVGLVFVAPQEGLSKTVEVRRVGKPQIERENEAVDARSRLIKKLSNGRLQVTRSGFDQAGIVTVVSGFVCRKFQAACRHINAGNFDEAAYYFRMHSEKWVGSADHLCGWANVLFLQGRLDEAFQVYRKALQNDSLHPGSLLGMMNIYTQRNNLDHAKELFVLLIENQSQAALAHNNLGNAYRASGLFYEALVHYGMALQIEPELTAGEYNRGGIFLSMGEFDRAARSFRSAAQSAPGFADAYLYEGLSHLRANRSVMATVALYRVLELGIDGQVVQLALGVALQSLHLDRSAVMHLRKAGELDQPDERINSLLSTSFVRLGELKQAAQVMLQDFDTGPKDAEAHFKIGLKLFLCEQYTLSASYLKKAVDLGRRDTDTYFALGQALMESGDFDSALDVLAYASNLTPQSARIHFSMGIAHFHRGEIVSAIREMEAAARLNPEDDDAKIVLMDLFRQVADFEACARTGRLVVNRNPELVPPRFETAYCQAMTGDLDKAVEMLEVALDQDTEGSQVHRVWKMLVQQTSARSRVPGMYLLLGMIQERRGDWKDAVRSYRRFISLSPSTHWIQKISRTLHQLDRHSKKSDPAFSGVP